MVLLKVILSLFLVVGFKPELLNGRPAQMWSNFDMPPPVNYGGTAVLLCEYNITEADFRSVSWYKDGDLIYQWVRDEPDDVFFEQNSGINVDLEKSNNYSLILQNVTGRAMGTWDCEVENTNPAMGVTKWSGNLTVIPPTIPVNCSDDILLLETLRQNFPDLVQSLPYLPEGDLDCIKP